MKTLYLMRHAKSSWADGTLDDHDRPLNDRGQSAAPLMARWLVENDCLPESIIASTAVRAKTTAELLIEHAGLELELITDRRLYHAYPDDMAEVARERGDEYVSQMLVGHNNGMQEMVSQFADRFIVFPTAAIAVIDLEIDQWCQLEDYSLGSLRELWLPKEIPAV